MMIEDIANRCLEWMNNVIYVHMDMSDGKPEGEHLDAIADAEFIIESIKMRMGEY